MAVKASLSWLQIMRQFTTNVTKMPFFNTLSLHGIALNHSAYSASQVIDT